VHKDILRIQNQLFQLRCIICGANQENLEH